MTDPTNIGLKVDQEKLNQRYRNPSQSTHDLPKNQEQKVKTSPKKKLLEDRGKDTVEISAEYFRRKSEEEKPSIH